MQSEKHVSITLADNSTETVTVKELRIADMPKYLDFLDDEEKIIALVTGKTLDSVQALPRESAEKIAEADMELNAVYFSNWLARRMARIERISPGATERLRNPKHLK